MTIDILSILGSVWQVLLVGLLFGAGLPALFSLGMRSLASGPETAEGPGALRVTAAWVCFGLCIAVALFGVVVIVFGKQIFGG